MCRDVSIANAEPIRHSVFAYLFQAAECLVAKSPATFGIESACQAVHNRINIRTDVEAPDIRVVADIHDDLYIFFRSDTHQSMQEFGIDRPAGENSARGRLRT